MKKYIVPFFFFVLFSLTGCKKNSNPASASHDPTTSANIATSAFLTTPSGGDPRGTYAPNVPILNFFANPNFPANFKTNLQTSSGSGTVTLSGSSASSGTYTTNNLSVLALGSITATYSGNTYTVPLAFTSGILKGQGTWSIISQGEMVFDSQDTLGYAVNDKGIFLMGPASTVDSTSGQTINFGTIVVAFKK